MNRKEYIGKQIAKARKNKRITQKTLAELTGIDKTSISKIEKGKLNVTIDTINRLCKAVGASIRMTESNIIFEDLVWEKHPSHLLAEQIGESYPNYKKNKTCYQAECFFDNGLHLSAVIGELFRSNGVNTYEVSLWTESGYEEVFGHLTDMQVNTLMEYAQIIMDAEILKLLKYNGFELFEHKMSILCYVKKYKEWYILVNPCGTPFVSASKYLENFSYIKYYQKIEDFKSCVIDLDTYIKYCEESENKKE